MPRDVEAGYALEQQRAGYTAAAEWLASDADNETFVFRKFDKLAALNLLFLQSEILQIEEKFAKLHQDALHGTMSVKDAGRRWEALMSQAQIGGPHFQQSAVEKMALVGELRVRMREYHETLLLQSQIAQLQHPQRRVLEALRHFFRRPRPILHGKASDFLGDANDLVAVKPPAETDVLSNFLRRHIGRKASTHKKTAGSEAYFGRFHESTVTTIVTVTTIFSAASLLLGPILGLYFVTSAVAKLVMVVVFTAAFAVILTLITNARRAEIFGGSAAYAAVLVVFVSNGSLSPT